MSSCVNFEAIACATTRGSTGLRFTGVGAICCGRLEMLLPNGVGNLDKGERSVVVVPLSQGHRRILTFIIGIREWIGYLAWAWVHSKASSTVL